MDFSGVIWPCAIKTMKTRIYHAMETRNHASCSLKLSESDRLYSINCASMQLASHQYIWCTFGVLVWRKARSQNQHVTWRELMMSSSVEDGKWAQSVHTWGRMFGGPNPWDAQSLVLVGCSRNSSSQALGSPVDQVPTVTCPKGLMLAKVVRGDFSWILAEGFFGAILQSIILVFTQVHWS